MSPAVSEKQRQLFCIALSMKRGETPESYSAQAAKLAKENDEATLKDYCEQPLKKG
jgi:hypothetical protein